LYLHERKFHFQTLFPSFLTKKSPNFLGDFYY
jgi:hypothetical protein